MSTIAIVLGIREYSRMAFLHWHMPHSINRLFWLVAIIFYAGTVEHFEYGVILFGLANAMFFVGCLWLTRSRVDNENLFPAMAVGSFGLIYCVLFPNFGVQLIKLEHGVQWFLFLMIVVFFGDTFAYFGGRFFGRHKMMPQISPNKTWEGALFGLFGSAVGGVIHNALAFPSVELWETFVFCMACGLTAQSGDLLMSLVKRVAQVKDSGGIMPGHGGILDRLDGVFIACPLVYAFALYAQ